MPFSNRRPSKGPGIARTALWLCCLCGAAAGAAGYVNDFSAAAPGKLPSDFQTAGGEFTVAERDGDKVLELAGEPLDTCGVLFGPSQTTEASASGRIRGESTLRRFPEFGVGVGDVGGYKLLLLPAQKKLTLRKGDDPLTFADLSHPWVSGSWTRFRLQTRKVGDNRWKVEGKAWPSDQPEPKEWIISHEAAEPPPAGRASVWGVAYSGKPIQFDDLAAAGG